VPGQTSQQRIRELRQVPGSMAGTIDSTQATPIRVAIVGHHALTLEALKRGFDSVPDIEVMGTATSLRELAELPDREAGRPDVMTLDQNLPDGTGIDACRLARARWPAVKILILAGNDDPGGELAAVEAGADGYISNMSGISSVIDAVRATFLGHLLLTPEVIGDITQRLADRSAERTLLQPLTPRELAVLRLLSLGNSTREMADTLVLREGTVRVHVEAIRRKFHASTRLEAVSTAIRHGIVEVPLA
jgi:two-component system, NarL family, response regulator DevR